MIKNQWYAVLNSAEVPEKKPIGVTRMREKLVFWRTTAGELTCFKDLCPHRGVALSTGKITNGHLQCPFHGFEFEPGGQCVVIPALGAEVQPPLAMRVEKIPVREEYGFIWIWWGEEREQYPPLRYFDSLDKSFSFVTIRDHWETHYSRAIENQLDVIHLPFIHRTTIGRGNRTVVDGPIQRWACDLDESCDLLNIWVRNRKEDGVPARRERELPEPDLRPLLQFQFPNVWHNWISDQVRVMVAFAPIDEGNTMMYLRFYQKISHLPVLKQFIHAAGSVGNLIIARQDKWVVETQQPKRSTLDRGETLIPGDRPIIEYRRRRQELILAGLTEI